MSMRYRPPAFAKPASVGEARLAYRCACGAPRGARRDPKRIVDTKRFALFGAPSPFI